MNKLFFYSTCLALLVSSNMALASNVSGVHGPNVNKDDRSMQFRIALSPSDENGQVDEWAYRLHYQYAFNDELRGRVVLQYRDRGTFEYQRLRGELLYNFKKKESGGIWSSGVRLDVNQNRGSAADSFSLHWSNQWDLENQLTVRSVLVGGWEFGPNKQSNDTSFATRASVGKKLDNGLTVGVEMFNGYGRIGEFGSFNSQSHQIGPMLGGKIGGFSYQVRYLAGVSGGSRDHNFGFRIDKAF